MNIDKSFQSAVGYYQTGRLREAESVCKQIIRKQPRHVDALNLLGVVYYGLADYDSAIEQIKKALTFNPSNAEAYTNLGNAYRNKRQLDNAVSCYEKAIKLKPRLAMAHNNLGSVLQEQGQTDEAAACYQKALTLDPQLAAAHNNVASLFLNRKEFDKAIPHLQKAIAMVPGFAEAYYNLGSALRGKGLSDDAIVYFQKAIGLNPNLTGAYEKLGAVFTEKGRFDEAIRAFRKALAFDPSNSEMHIALGNAFRGSGQFDEAVSCYQKAIQLNPKLVTAYYNLGVALQAKGHLTEASKSYEKALELDPGFAEAYNNLGSALKAQGRLDEAEVCYRRAIQADPDYVVPYENLLFGMLYNPRYDAQTIFSEHLEFGRRFAKSPGSGIPRHRDIRITDRRLRVGYVSPDFVRHSVSYFIEPVLNSHSRDAVEVCCYANMLHQDEVTTRLQARADKWRNIFGMSDDKVSELIHHDAIDILVDLSGHTFNNRLLLFAGKPAPVQVSWIGYPATTGLDAMDYKIVDGYTDPPGMTEKFYTEELMRLPETFLCYLPYEDSPRVGTLPALSRGHITFGSFNNFAKVSQEVLVLWSRILREVPHSRLIMKSKSFSDEATRHHTTDRFEKEGVTQERIELLPAVASTAAHLDLYNRIDIALDTFPYNGTTTTCEAMWMGVPVITLSGSAHAARVGVSLLSNAGLTNLIAKTHDEYAEIAVGFATDIHRLQTLREGLRDKVARSPLTDARKFTANLETCYRKMWELLHENKD